MAEPVARAPTRVMLIAAVRTVGTATLLFVLYAVLPIGEGSAPHTVLLLVLGLVVYLVVATWQVRHILHDEYPYVRAGEAFGVVIPLLIVTFALIYLALWHSDHQDFSESLDRVGAIYFTVTTLATVGFGDIVARGDTARLIVIIQIVVDLAVVGIFVRLVLAAARIGTQRRQAERSQAETSEADPG